MKLHELKIKRKYFDAILEGKKTFELRKNDRDYQVGDLIWFIVVSDYGSHDGLKHGETYQITYILNNVPEYGLDKDYCILGIKRLKAEEK